MQNWRPNLNKIMGILQREYGITRNQALWEYSFEELQTLIQELPLERIVRIGSKDTQSDLERKWLEAVADFDTSIIKKDKELYEIRVKRLELKNKIKHETNPERRKKLEETLNNIS